MAVTVEEGHSAEGVPERAQRGPVNRVSLRLTRKPPPPPKPKAEPLPEIDVEKAVAFGMAIAAEKKRLAMEEEARQSSEETLTSVPLAKRPTSRTRGETSTQFSATDLKEFRRRLMQAREKALSSSHATGSLGEAHDCEADGGDGTDQTLRLQALRQMGNQNRVVQQIEEALHRIDDGTYGICTMCGQLIRKPRLLNQPFVQTCMECQTELERRARR